MSRALHCLLGSGRLLSVTRRGEARIREEVAPAGLDWISALCPSAIRRLVKSGVVQMSLFDQTDLVEIRSEAYPGERLMVCRNPLLQAERALKREELLRATERPQDPIATGTERDKRPLTGRERIALLTKATSRSRGATAPSTRMTTLRRR